MKAAVIGGAGLLGSAVMADLITRELFREITLIDAQAGLAKAEIEDLRAAHLDRDVQVNFATQIDSASQSDVIVICRGFAPQSDESRLDLARRHLAPFCWLLSELNRVGIKQDVVVIIAAEPSELMAALAAAYLKLPANQIIGIGTVVDERRLRTGLAECLSTPIRGIQISAIGVRGKHLVPLWSSCTISGQPANKLRPWESTWQHDVEQQTRLADFTQLRGKGGAWRAPAAAVADVARAVVRDERVILPVCVSRQFLRPVYGLRRTSVALPTVVGRQGALDVVEQKLWPKELAALKQGARETARSLVALATQS